MDHYYAEPVEKVEAKRIDTRPKRALAIGNDGDQETRQDLRRLYDRKGIPYGRGQKVGINNRDYDTRQPGKPPYRVPDLRIGDARPYDGENGDVRIDNLTIDWTIRYKQPGDSQINDFFNADSKPKAVVIIMPSQRYPAGPHL